MMLFNLAIIIVGLFFFNLYSKQEVKIYHFQEKNTDDLFLTFYKQLF